MSRIVSQVAFWLFSLGLVLQSTPAYSQPLGTFRWRLAPYCNVLTLSVTQLGSQYRFEGTDDQCGAPTRAPVTGLGVPNTDGTLEFGFTIVTAAGPSHLDVTFSVGFLSGTWRDSAGATGTFAFNPPTPTPGAPRPAPTALVADGSITTAKLAPLAVTSDRLADAAVNANKVLDGSLGASDIDSNQIQRRVSGTCPAGQYLRSINNDGSVICAIDQAAGGAITAVTAGPGLTGGGTTGTVTLAAAFGGSGAASFVARSDHTHGDGNDNTMVGQGALTAVLGGLNNTVMGARAADSLTSGLSNTVMGVAAADAMTSGIGNVAIGETALAASTESIGSVAVGYRALRANPNGGNTAVGYRALENSTTTGSTAVGFGSLPNASGASNTAVGENTLALNSLGAFNVALGRDALAANVVGSNNTAIGYRALKSGTGTNNVSLGHEAHESLTSGSSNIAIGKGAGNILTTGSSNIHIGNGGTGVDDNLIRIGSGQTKTFIAGIRGVTTGFNNASQVFIDAAGQLGTVNSSRRYKDDIRDLDPKSVRLQLLRPVQFRYFQPFDKGSRPIHVRFDRRGSC